MPTKQGEETALEYELNLIYMHIILAQKMMKEDKRFEGMAKDLDYMKSELSNVLHDVWNINGA